MASFSYFIPRQQFRTSNVIIRGVHTDYTKYFRSLISLPDNQCSLQADIKHAIRNMPSQFIWSTNQIDVKLTLWQQTITPSDMYQLMYCGTCFRS